MIMYTYSNKTVVAQSAVKVVRCTLYVLYYAHRVRRMFQLTEDEDDGHVGRDVVGGGVGREEAVDALRAVGGPVRGLHPVAVERLGL